MSQQAVVRTKEKVRLIKKSGRITAAALKKTLASVTAGITLTELDRMAEEEIVRLGGQASFKTVPGYYFATCLTINNEVVHGLPRPIKLQLGDILSIDVGAVYQGWHTDAAWSVVVDEGTAGNRYQKERQFLEVGEKTLWSAIRHAVAGQRIGDISAAIQRGIESEGFSVVKSLSGHGVGRTAHEEPEIPEYGQSGTGPKLKAGMVLAIEVIYTQGSGELFKKEDGWTLASVEGGRGGLFEMSVIVGRKKPEIITDWRGV